jgi:hypothetical protein
VVVVEVLCVCVYLCVYVCTCLCVCVCVCHCLRDAGYAGRARGCRAGRWWRPWGPAARCVARSRAALPPPLLLVVLVFFSCGCGFDVGSCLPAGMYPPPPHAYGAPPGGPYAPYGYGYPPFPYYAAAPYGASPSYYPPRGGA